MAAIDVLVPTYRRPAALALTLLGVAGQTFRDFRVVVSDQTEAYDAFEAGEVQSVVRLLRHRGHEVDLHKHLPRRGIAEHRQFLLDQAAAPACLFLDDDLLLEPWTLDVMVRTLEQEGCGFVGCAPIGLSFVADVRPEEQAVELWEGAVVPESMRAGLPAWHRHRLHNAANVLHVQRRLGATPERPIRYKVAWVGACALYRTQALQDAGGYDFWPRLPSEHCGEDALAQQRVMERYGGCGLLPSGVYHQELPTTIADRRINAAVYLG